MKEKKDIGQIISSKLKSKYDDDFFDESKGWDTVMGKLPQKGFWDWGFTHVNIYYVALSLSLIAALIYVGYDSEKDEKTPTIHFIEGNNEEDSKLKNQGSNTFVKGNQGVNSSLKNLSQENRVSSTEDQNFPSDSALDFEKHNSSLDAFATDSTIQTLEHAEFKSPQKEIITPENTSELQKFNMDKNKRTKDSTTIAQPLPKKDTIRRRIKRFD